MDRLNSMAIFVIGQNPQSLDIWHGSKLGWIEYAVEVPI